MLTVEAFKNHFVRQAAIDFSQSVDLSSSINSAARLIGYDMKGPEIRAVHNKTALAATSVAQAVPLLNETTHTDQLENLRRAAGLTLNDYDFSRANLFSGGWGLVVFGRGSGAEKWNKWAFLVPGTVPIQEEKPSATAIEISLAQLSFPFPDAPTIVQAKMVPLVTVDAQGVRLESPQAPHICKIYNAQHVLTTINPPLFSPRLVYPVKKS